MTVNVTFLKGPVTVAYRKQGRKWYAIALEFDLVGIGPTRQKAFNELQAVFNDYLIGCAEEEGPVQFLFPAEPSEWNIEDKEWFRVTAIIVQPKKPRKEVPSVISLSDLHSLRGRIQSFGLVPEAAVA